MLLPFPLVHQDMVEPFKKFFQAQKSLLITVSDTLILLCDTAL